MVWIVSPPWGNMQVYLCPTCNTYHLPGACPRCGWWPNTFPEPPQPWECPRCHKMHGPASLTCNCAPTPTEMTMAGVAWEGQT